MLPSTAAPSKAAVDITTGYGADGFLYKTESQEPWSRRCFMTLLDLAINYPDFYYPLPTTESMKEDVDSEENLPKSIALMRGVRMLAPFHQSVAGQVSLAEEDLQKQFAYFCDWVRNPVNAWELRGWLALHSTPEKRKTLEKRVPGGVQPFTIDFWDRNQVEAERLAKLTGETQERLRYAFDVMFRGLQYYRILADGGIQYFAHPIRIPLFRGQETIHYEYPGEWSWGQLITTLIEDQKLRKEPEEIIEIVHNIRGLVLTRKASWTDLRDATKADKKKQISEIAADCMLPAKVKKAVLLTIATILAVAANLTQLAPPPVVTVTLGIGAIALNQWNPYVPGTVGQQLKFCRGVLEWPGLYNEKSGYKS